MLKGKVVLITGASSGIGEALALELAQRGARLVLTGRRVDRLSEVAAECEKIGAKALAIEADVTRDGDLEKAVVRAIGAFGELHVVVANAGFGVSSRFEKLTLEDYRRQFETNVFGVLRTGYATLKHLKNARGQFVVIGSVAGYVALPGSSPYSMSKFAVRGFAEAVRAEFRQDGVDLTLISPGFVDSEIRKVDNKGVLHESSPDPVPRWIRVSSKNAAIEIADAIDARKKEQVVTGHGKVILFLKRFFPWVIDYVVSRGLKNRPEPKSG